MSLCGHSLGAPFGPFSAKSAPGPCPSTSRKISHPKHHPMILRNTILSLTLTTLPATAGTTLVDAKGPVAPSPAPPAPKFHPNAQGAHRPSANLATADGLGFEIVVPYESILYYRGARMGENGTPFRFNMDVKITDTLTWANDYKFINFINDDSADTKLHLWTALFYQMGDLSIGPSFKFHRNNSAGSTNRDAYDIGVQALYDFGPVKLGGGYSYDLESEGHYVEVGLSAPIKITSKLTITPAAEVTYLDGWVRPVEGMNNIALRVTAAYKINPMFALAPFVGYNIPLDVTEDRYSEEFIAGAALHVKF